MNPLLNFQILRGKTKSLLLFALAVLVVSACAAEQPPRSTPAEVPTRIPTRRIPPTLTHMERPTPSATLLPTPSDLTWATAFANPILERVTNATPNFQDDFSDQLNHGWFYFIPNSRKGPFYAHLENDTLLLKIPDAFERKDSMVYSPRLLRNNFVMSLDFKFGKSQPNDIFRLQFKESAEQSVTLDLSKDETSTIHWSFYTERESSTGEYQYFGPEFINIVVIMNSLECAVYINHDPFMYLNDCRSSPIIQASPSAVSIHLVSTTADPAIVTIDNIKQWDLDHLLK